jgi:hypothetical protein
MKPISALRLCAFARISRTRVIVLAVRFAALFLFASVALWRCQFVCCCPTSETVRQPAAALRLSTTASRSAAAALAGQAAHALPTRPHARPVQTHRPRRGARRVHATAFIARRDSVCAGPRNPEAPAARLAGDSSRIAILRFDPDGTAAVRRLQGLTEPRSSTRDGLFPKEIPNVRFLRLPPGSLPHSPS